MDIFRQANTREATALDLYCPFVNHSRQSKRNDKRILKKLARTRLRRDLRRRLYGNYED